ncbi:diguanylate cyclase [Microcoleus sp. EPA2]|uniref:diguanylate cyclase n=1 Tax=Microcoleus sp. EPA2 TaxID=2841654 RepID=UPI00312B853B
MSDCEKTKEQLMDELEALRAELATLKSLRSPREHHQIIENDAPGDRQISLPELLNALQKLIHEQTSYLANINAHLHEEIAERKLLEKKLAYSENKIRSIFEAMTDVILIVNLQGEDLNSIDIAPMNNLALDALRSEIVNQTINRFFQESLNSDWLQRVRHVATSRKTAQLDYSLSVGTQLLWFSAMISPINETAVTWVARDISDRKLAEAKLQQLNTELEQRILERTIALRQSEAHLQEAQKFAKLGSWEFDVFTNQVIWSPEIYQIYGLDTQEAEFTPEQVWHKFLPEDRECLKNHLNNAIQCRESYATDLKFMRVDGSWGYIFAKGEPICNESGEVVRIVGIMIDITERKQSEIMLINAEKRWKFVFDNVQLVVVEFDINGVIKYINPFFLNLTDYTEAEVLGRSWLETFVPRADWQQVENVFSQKLGSQNHCYYENRILTKSGIERFIVWNNTVLKNSAGNTIGIFSIGEDITDRKATETALQESKQQYQTLVENSPNIIERFDTALRHLYVSPSLTKITGIAAEVFLGKTCRELALSEAMINNWETAAEILLRTGKKQTIEFETLTLNGVRSFEMEMAPELTNQGIIESILCLSRDVTERKLAAETLQRVNQELQERVAELKQRNAEMLLLNGISDYLQSCLTVAEACATIGTLSQPLFPESCGAIFMMTNSRDLLEMVTSWGNSLYSETIFVPKDCWGLRRGRLHWIGGERHDLFCNHIDHQNPPVESLCMPMIAQGETIGLLYLCASKPHQMTENRQLLARRVAEQLGLAIANITLREKLVNQSIRDSLTGLFNRRYLEEFLTKEIARAQRNQYSVGTIMLDLDRFREFNNTLGHDAGDLVLKEIGKLLNNMIRASDVACRYGGEEMTIILPEASLEGTYQKAEEIRKAIEKLQLNYQGKKMTSITASLGVASYPDRGKTGFAVIQAADAALYRAKAAGRNQVIVADDG